VRAGTNYISHRSEVPPIEHIIVLAQIGQRYRCVGGDACQRLGSIARGTALCLNRVAGMIGGVEFLLVEQRDE
jgi:hypothetical protein